MLQTVQFSRKDIAEVSVSLRNPDPSGFTIREIRGLDAGAVDLHINELATMPGGAYNGFRKPTREIVVELGFGNQQTPEEGRALTYDLFPLGGLNTLEFITDTRSYEIEGYVESNDAPLFTDEPSLQIVFMCSNNPYFRSTEEDRIHTTFRSFEKKFQFPFSNESLTEPLLKMGEYTQVESRDIYYDGSIPNGIRIVLSASDTVVDPLIYHETSNTSMRLVSSIIATMTGGPFSVGDIIEINTIRGSKSVTLTRSGREYNILNALAPSSGWIQFGKGLNKISLHADSGIEYLEVDIFSDTLYQGL